jgi:hypothetical protein
MGGIRQSGPGNNLKQKSLVSIPPVGKSLDTATQDIPVLGIPTENATEWH